MASAFRIEKPGDKKRKWATWATTSRMSLDLRFPACMRGVTYCYYKKFTPTPVETPESYLKEHQNSRTSYVVA